MRILQINAVYGQGSTGTIVRDIEQLCFKSGIECYVASPDPKVCEAKHGYVIGNTLDHKLHALLSRIHGKQAYFSHIPTRNLLRWMDEVKPDIVHLHNLHSNYIQLNMLLQYLAERDIRTIITLHDCWFYTGGCFHYTADGCKGWLDNCGVCPNGKGDPIGILGKHTSRILAYRKKYLLAIPRLIVTGVSDWISEEACRTFLSKSNIVTVHNGVDMQIFKPTTSDFRKRLGLEGKFVVLGPASKWLLPVNKGVLMDFTKLMQSDEILLLFGVCSEAQKEYISSLGLGDKIVSYGFTRDRKELAQLYTMADVFANTTREDSLSLVNVEAQACGTPVVTFDQTGPKETVDDFNSFNVLVGKADLLYKAVQKVRVQTTDATSENCRHFVEEFFEVNNNYQMFINLYQQII